MKDIPCSDEKKSSKWLVDLFREKVLAHFFCTIHTLNVLYMLLLKNTFH